MYLAIDQTAPDFKLLDQNNQIVSLETFRGQNVLLYFYPKDDTPGCTTEACNFRDDYSSYENANVVILGVSPDTPASHKKFKDKYQLPFTLLADENHQVCELYKVWGPKKSFGKEYDGVHRTTYLIDPDGIIREVFQNVSPANHSAEVLEIIS
jgi:thioredoxin-dependent peroxiredoxin